MIPFVFILLVLDVAALIRAQVLKRRYQVYLLKPLATLLVIAVAWMARAHTHGHPLYTNGILAGLFLSLLGDVALMWEDVPRAFLAGLGSFLLAHIAYTVTFASLETWHPVDVLLSLLLLAIGVGFYRLIRPGVGKMGKPVLLYIFVISFMLERAFATLWTPSIPSQVAWRVALGAFLFYLSDMILAINRFWRPWRYNRVGLALYYVGQFLLAWAAHLF